MKRSLLLVLLLILLIAVFISFKYKLNKDLSQPVRTPTSSQSMTITPVKKMGKINTSLFIPYWTLSGNFIEMNEIDEIIYFGIKPDKLEISNTEHEEEQLKKFIDFIPYSAPKLLAIRMTDSEENLQIISDRLKEQKTINQSIEIAKNHKFKGIVLDLEISAIPLDSIIKQINKFVSDFYTVAKNNKLSFRLAIFGDSFYRVRPYDIKTLAQNTDMIMIMAYDLHKVKGNPGPNFPLGGKDKFGYDLNSMIDDFLQFVPPEKISVIFGLFGYDWIISEKGQVLYAAKALTLNQIKEKFLNKCEATDCRISRDKKAGELQIRYTDQDNKNHIIWLEDMESAKLKQEFLKQKGITSFSYWAYSYF